MNLFILFLAGCFSFLTFSCGLDTVYYIEGPVYVENPPVYDNYDDKIRHVFTFTTNEDDEYGDFKFQGTDVYYKIYTRYSDDSVTTDAYSEINKLNSLNSDSNTYTNPYDILNSLKYRPLNLSSSKGGVLIPYTGKNRKINIRLTDFGSSEKAGVYIGGVRQEGTLSRARDGLSEKSFIFSGKNETDAIPASGDFDVSYTDFEFNKENTFYVVLYAMAVGTDLYWTQYYSNILYLGCVPVSVSDFQ